MDSRLQALATSSIPQIRSMGKGLRTEKRSSYIYIIIIIIIIIYIYIKPRSSGLLENHSPHGDGLTVANVRRKFRREYYIPSAVDGNDFFQSSRKLGRPCIIGLIDGGTDAKCHQRANTADAGIANATKRKRSNPGRVKFYSRSTNPAAMLLRLSRSSRESRSMESRQEISRVFYFSIIR